MDVHLSVCTRYITERTVVSPFAWFFVVVIAYGIGYVWFAFRVRKNFVAAGFPFHEDLAMMVALASGIVVFGILGFMNQILEWPSSSIMLAIAAIVFFLASVAFGIFVQFFALKRLRKLKAEEQDQRSTLM